jgi:tetratricopeptide (TPR) repeat protein
MADAVQYAAILDGLERYEESEPIYRRALAILEAALGPDHEEIGATCHNLAALLAARGDHQEAERYYRRALAIRERILGRAAPDTALTCNNLGKLLTDIGRPDEAVPLLASAVATLERQLAPDHSHLARIRENFRQAKNKLAAFEQDS